MATKPMAIDVSKISITVNGYGVVNTNNVLKFVENEQLMLQLVETQYGRKLLAETVKPHDSGDLVKNEGPSALLLAVINFESVALKLIETQEGINLLVETRFDGRTILHAAVELYEKVALKLIEKEEGKNLLASTKENNTNWSSLHVAVNYHESVANKLTETEDGIKLLSDTKDWTGASVLDLAKKAYPDIALKFVNDIKRS
ncbi:MAG: hypothetical protein ABR981_00180 [Candidatus Micrarchaeaceae archaeon]|jgi:uncharacterized protein YlaN (UPF0358 family)